MRRPSVEAPDTGASIQLVPAPPPTAALANGRRRTSVRFAEASSAEASADETPAEGRPRQRSLVVSESGEVLPTPQALHDVLGDAATRHVLATHRATIRSALAAAAVDGSVLLAPETFRSTLLSLQLGFNPKQVDDLLQCLVYLGRLGEARGAMPPAVGPDGITELVRFSLLFQHDDASTAPAAPEPPGLVRQSDSAVALAPPAPAGNQQRRQNKWADAERSGAHREKVGRSFRLPSVEVLMPKGSEDTIMAMLDSDDDGDDAHGNGAAVALGGSEEEEDDDEDDDDEEDEFEQLSAELKVTRARALANNRANNAQRFRMPSVEELILDAVGSRDGSGDAGGVDSSASGKPARRRETMPGRCDLATRDDMGEGERRHFVSIVRYSLDFIWLGRPSNVFPPWLL
jgi:hypothetical protein